MLNWHSCYVELVEEKYPLTHPSFLDKKKIRKERSKWNRYKTESNLKLFESPISSRPNSSGFQCLIMTHIHLVI